MAEPYLLVPMHLDAMVLNQEARDATPFLRFSMEYDNLQSFNSPDPGPFSANLPQPDAGIYVHWTLPKALRHGVHEDDGSTSFPIIPNRWLIVRSTMDGGAQVKAWLLESDYSDPSGAEPGSSPYVNPASQNGAPQKLMIGRVLPFDSDLKSIPEQTAPFLTAVAPGSVTFTVYSPGIDNVLSFYDDVTGDDDTTKIENAHFTYSVTGWYSAQDPLSDPKVKWVANTDATLPGTYTVFDWYVYAPSADLPRQMLLHAMTSNVVWQRGAENPPADNFPKDLANTVKVSFGNTAIDALAGIVREVKSDPMEADMLEAFQYGLLDKFDEPGSSERLNAAIRERWFGATSGGTQWQVVPPPTDVNVQTLLDQLNVSQHELDRGQRILESMQWNLFSLWYKNNYLNTNSPDIDPALSTFLSAQLPLHVTTSGGHARSSYIAEVKAQQALVAKAQTDVRALKTMVTAALTSDFTLKPISLPSYYYPNDPVVVITGLGRSDNFDPVDGVLCRLPSQVLTQLTVNGTSYPFATPLALSDPNKLLPPAVIALHNESYFLSPALFEAVTSTKDADVQAALKAATKTAGAQFTPLAYAWEVWAQPWVPLLLDWSVSVMIAPGYSAQPDSSRPHQLYELDQQNWQFNGTDYTWVGPMSASGDDFSEVSIFALKGRTFITPQLTLTLAAQLDEYVQKHKLRDPDLEKLLEDLDQYVRQIASGDVISQRLSGMMAGLVERQFVQNVAPTPDIAPFLGGSADDSSRDYRHGYPRVDVPQIASYNTPPFAFAPLRGTFYVVTGLTVIDTFGRSVDVLQGNNSQWQGTGRPEYYFYPIAGRDVRAPMAKPPGSGVSANASERVLQMTPTLVQDARLDVRLVSNDETNTDIDLACGTNPICGWIVPNHLDRSISVYAPDGTAWGELLLSKHEQNNYVPSWQPDPTVENAPDSIGAIPNKFVRRMLGTLNDRPDNGIGFFDFMQVIDETLWTINPRGQRQDQNLSVLIGRPLAVVRARVSLQMRGLPSASQDWWNTFNVDPFHPPDPSTPAQIGAFNGGVFDRTWPVRLGSQALRSDGVVGYYLDDPHNADNTFTKFNTLVLPPDMKTDYLQQIGTGNYMQLRFIDDTMTAPDPSNNQVCYVTMLVDPRGQAHAFSGLLPVATLEIPDAFVTPALKRMSYLFRAGPFLTSVDAVRIPLPAENKGTWSWFDEVAKQAIGLVAADASVRLESIPPLAREGWLKFVPNPASNTD